MEGLPLKSGVDGNRARTFAVLTILVFVISEIVSILIFRLTQGQTYYQVLWWLSIKALTLFWALPILIVYKVEGGDYKSLGLYIPPGKYLPYTLYVLIGLVLPALVLDVDLAIFVELAEQILYIGVAEEFFYRGYMQTRMCYWLGNSKGLLFTSLLFGLGHVISKLAQSGFSAFLPASLLGIQAFAGGLLLGYIYLRAKNIWPSTFIHVSMNLYLPVII